MTIPSRVMVACSLQIILPDMLCAKTPTQLQKSLQELYITPQPKLPSTAGSSFKRICHFYGEGSYHTLPQDRRYRAVDLTAADVGD